MSMGKILKDITGLDKTPSTVKTPKWSSESMERTLDDIRTTFEMIKNEEQKDAETRGEDPGSPYVQEMIYARLCEMIPRKDVKQFRDNFFLTTQRRDEILQRILFETTQAIKNDWCRNSGLLTANYIKTIARDKVLRDVNGKITYDIKTRIVPVTDYYDESTIDQIMNRNPHELIPEFWRSKNRLAALDELEILSVSNLKAFYNPKNRTQNRDILDIAQILLYSRIKNSQREKAKAVDWATGMRAWDDYPFDTVGIQGVFPDEAIGKLAPGEILYKFTDFIYTDKMARNKDKILKNTMTQTEYRNNTDEWLVKLTQKYNRENYRKILDIINKADRELTNFKKGHNMDNLSRLEEILFKKLKGASLQGIQGKGYIDGERAEIWAMSQAMFRAYTGEHIGHTGDYIYGRDEFRNTYKHNPALSDGQKKLHEGEKNPYEPSLAIVIDMMEKGLFDEMFTITSLVREMYRSR